MASSAARALRDPIAANLARVRERVARACARVGRDPAGVALVLVTKYSGRALIETLLELGERDLGENRVDRIIDLAARFPPAGAGGPRWHMIGHLQRNKARKVAGVLDALHSLDSGDLAERLERRRSELSSPPLPAWIEVNLGGEAQKAGVPAAELATLAAPLRRLSHVRVEGLMTLPPAADDPEASRPHFRRLRELLPELSRALGREVSGLSMGMTHDLEVAVEEGATAIRVGRALIEGVPADLLGPSGEES